MPESGLDFFCMCHIRTTVVWGKQNWRKKTFQPFREDLDASHLSDRRLGYLNAVKALIFFDIYRSELLGKNSFFINPHPVLVL